MTKYVVCFSPSTGKFAVYSERKFYFIDSVDRISLWILQGTPAEDVSLDIERIPEELRTNVKISNIPTYNEEEVQAKIRGLTTEVGASGAIGSPFTDQVVAEINIH